MLNCNPCTTPIDTDSKLGTNGHLVPNPTLYCSLVGALWYTHPDISYEVQQVLIFMHDRGSLIFQLRSASYTMFETLWVMVYGCFLPLGIVCFLAATFFPGP
jgi:hypothetical protein